QDRWSASIPNENRLRLKRMNPDGSGITLMTRMDAWATGLLGVDRVTGQVYYGAEKNNYPNPNSMLLKRADANTIMVIQSIGSVEYSIGGPYNGWDRNILSFYGITPKGAALETSAPEPITAPDLTLTQSPSRTSLAPTDPLTYTLSIRNVGPSNATGVVLTDTLPLGVTFVSATSSRGEMCPAPSGNRLTCSLQDIPFGTTVT